MKKQHIKIQAQTLALVLAWRYKSESEKKHVKLYMYICEIECGRPPYQKKLLSPSSSLQRLLEQSMVLDELMELQHRCSTSNCILKAMERP